MSTAPLKPWEKTSGVSQNDEPPEIPARPSALDMTSTAPGLSSMANRWSPYNRPSYNSYSPYNSYSNSYSGYNNYGGYQDAYTPYRNNTYGYTNSWNRYPNSSYNDFNNPQQRQMIPESTQQAFQVMDQFIQAFGGFAHMLESAFHATHSSFMAIMSLAQHFGQISSFISRALSAVAVIASLQRLFQRRPHRNNQGISVENFLRTQGKSSRAGSKAAFMFFGLVALSPLIISLLIRRWSKKKLPTSPTPPSKTPDAPLIQIHRAKFDFNATSPQELSFKKGDLVAVTGQLKNGDGSSTWWNGRLQNGMMGLFPATYVETSPIKCITPP